MVKEVAMGWGWTRFYTWLTIAACVLGQVGCGDGKGTPEVTVKDPATEKTAVTPAKSDDGEPHITPVSGKPTNHQGLPRIPKEDDPEFVFLHQPFEVAEQKEVPKNALPPNLTVAGKSVGRLFQEVKSSWSQIRFVSAQGTEIQYTAKIETEKGVVEMELWPKVAPNHVRAFVALAQAGYYDGLYFESRFGSRNVPDLPRALAGGSPEGDGRDVASIGFWLLPEILRPEKAEERGVKHEAGTVFTSVMGCRFYLALTPAPAWEGTYTLFGKITKGLDVAEKLFDDLGKETPGEAQPTPPQIRKVTISSKDTGKPWAIFQQ
jgi:peptidyl-prolyl cis-trans isomerase B (cyclophilin B)